MGKDVDERSQHYVDCRCKCLEKFNDGEKSNILKEFNELAEHEKQNIYLRGCISVKEENTIRRKQSQAVPKTFCSSYSYTIKETGSPIPVCKNAFCALHGIKESRLKKKVLDFEEPLQDLRGKHGHHKKLNDEIRQTIRQHISSFPARESHYSRADNRKRIYLTSDLNISEIFRLFLEQHPDMKTIAKEWIYRDIFNYEFNISFGFPRTDVCDTCEKFNADIKFATVNRNNDLVLKLRTEHEVHKRKGDAFYEQIREDKHLALSTDDTQVIAMDFQKNLLLPVTGIGQEYYKRQLAVHNLGIHDVCSGNASMYIYAENFAHKGPNEVLSCLEHYIDELPESIRKLVIFTDNCFSQNKNRYIVAFLQNLCNTKLSEVVIKYPIPGHSRMPCDRDFGRIEKKKLKTDKFHKPSDLVNLIAKSSINSSWKIVYVEHPFTDNLEMDSRPVVRVKDFKSSLDKVIKAPEGIASLRGILFERLKNPVGRSSMTGPLTSTLNLLKRGKSMSTLKSAIIDCPLAFNGFLPIKKAKFNDIMSLLSHVHLPESVTFYTSLKPIEMSPEEDEQADDFE